MAFDATDVTVAGGGHVYLAPEATAFPTGVAAPASEWIDVGYIDEDGVTFSRSRSSDALRAWQSNEPIRTLITGVDSTVAFVLRQFSPANVQYAFGGGSFTAGATFGTYDLPAPSDIDVLSMILQGIDGTEEVRVLYPRVQVAGDIEIQMTSDNALNLPCTFTVLASDDPVQIISNKASWLT